jgi:hypothetical protein
MPGKPWFLYTITRCTQPPVFGCILGAKCACINFARKGEILRADLIQKHDSAYRQKPFEIRHFSGAA